MEKDKKFELRNKGIAVLYIILALVLIMGPHSIFSICDSSEKLMKCYYSTQTVAAIAVLLGITGVLFLFATTRESHCLLSIVVIAEAMVVILIPAKLIGGCPMKTMLCQSKTFPSFYIIATIYIITALFVIMKWVRAYEKKTEPTN